MSDETMPEWVLIEAGKRSGWADKSPHTLLQLYRSCAHSAYRALCDMILKHEQPPVDPKLLLVREACAQIFEESGMEDANNFRTGDWDDFHSIRAALLAIDLWEKRQ